MRKPAPYRFPRGMRPASVQERTEFYGREFPIEKVGKWFRGWDGPVVFAVVLGRHTRIYPREYRTDWKKTILIDEYRNLQDLREELVEFRPESAYYDRNVYGNWEQARLESDKIRGLGRDFGQQLAFDVDPENFDCPIHGSLDEKMAKRQGLSFCRLELQLAQQQTIDLFDLLERRFSQLQVVYSGRGFHIHVFDKHTFYWTRGQRLKLVGFLQRRGFVMDEWVAAGGMRLIRLPYSLNGLVSRIAVPLRRGELDGFNPLTEERCVPRFLRAGS